MATKNSQILLIENVLANLNEHINEKEQEVKFLEEDSAKLKSTISTLKHECKTAFDEQERLEDIIDDLKKQNGLLSEQLRNKDEELHIKTKELESTRIQNEQFMDSVEKRVEEFKKQLEDKNSIISELENINKELNKQLHATQKQELKTVTRLERKLEQEEFKNFINSKDTFDFSTSKYDKIDKNTNYIPSKKQNNNLNLDKLQSKLKGEKKPKKLINNSHIQTEEDILKKNLGF